MCTNGVQGYSRVLHTSARKYITTKICRAWNRWLQWRKANLGNSTDNSTAATAAEVAVYLTYLAYKSGGIAAVKNARTALIYYTNLQGTKGDYMKDG